MRLRALTRPSNDVAGGDSNLILRLESAKPTSPARKSDSCPGVGTGVMVHRPNSWVLPLDVAIWQMAEIDPQKLAGFNRKMEASGSLNASN